MRQALDHAGQGEGDRADAVHRGLQPRRAHDRMGHGAPSVAELAKMSYGWEAPPPRSRRLPSGLRSTDMSGASGAHRLEVDIEPPIAVRRLAEDVCRLDTDRAADWLAAYDIRDGSLGRAGWS